MADTREQTVAGAERQLAAAADLAERIYLLSFLTTATGRPEHLAALSNALADPSVTIEQQHFFYWQRLIRHGGIDAGPSLHPARMYTALLERCRVAVPERRDWIPPAERDDSRIVVITNQLLGPQHAPTADCLDYCVVLQRQLGKQVLLVNTADMPWSEPLRYYQPVRFNREEGYTRLARLDVRGESIEFYQCRKPMPNVQELGRILRMVQARRPSFVFSLGHSNVAADLCADIVSVTTMPFGTNLPQARSTVYVLPRRRGAEDAAVMAEWEIADERIIEAEYTFRLPERTASLSRAELGIPAAAFAVAIVGNRLDAEITAEVASELSALVTAIPAAFIVFMGTFGTYETVCRTHPALAVRSAFVGHQRDVLAVYERCDLYINPPRYGGGSSAAFALAMGVPVLTLGEGDVANIVGETFIVASFDAMRAMAARLAAGPELRARVAATARARFARISDREGMLRTIVDGTAARAGLLRSGF